MIKKLILCTSMLAAAFMLQAQTDTLLLDRETTLELAFENNPTLSIAQLERQRAQARYKESRGNLLPTLNATGSFTRNLKKQVIFFPEEMAPLFGGVTALEVGSDNSFLGAASVALPLYNPAAYANIHASRVEQRLASENLRAVRIDLTYNVQAGWYDALLAKESLEVVQLSFQNAKENLENIRKLYQQGLVSEYDLIRAQVQTENIRPDVLQAESFYELSLNYLKTLLGLEEEIPVQLSGSMIDSSEEMLEKFNVVQAQRALHDNPDYVNLGLQRELVLEQSKAVRATGLPSVTAVGNYAYLTEANDFKIGDYNWVNTASAGLQVNIPIFRGFTNRNQVRQLQIGAEQLQLQREYLKDNLEIELGNLLRSMQVATEKAVHARKNVELAQRGYEIARVRYDSGQGTLLEVNDSDMALTRARFNLLQAKHELLQAKARYDRFIGETQNI